MQAISIRHVPVYVVLCLAVAASLVAQTDSVNGRPSVGGIPLIFWTPETGLIGGGILSYSREFPSTASVTVPVIYTQKKSYFAGLFLDVAWNNGVDRLRAEGQCTNFEEDFYGVGNDMPNAARETYTPVKAELKLMFDRRVADHLYAGIVYSAGSYRVTHERSGGLLWSMGLGGTPSTEVSGIGGAATWDSRDNANSARRGAYARSSAVRYDAWVGSERNYTQVETDVRFFLPVGTHSALGLQVYSVNTLGDAPIQAIAQWGGPNVMRGYYPGRYRDRHLLAVQTEYRGPLFWRINGAVFAGVGDVAHRVGDFNAGDMKYSAGFGLRFVLDRKARTSVRLDVAFGRHSANPAISFNEAF